MKFQSGTSSSTIRVSLTIALVTTLLSVLPTAAQAIGLPDGTYNCLTGLASPVTPAYSITSGVVTNGESCTGAVVIPEGVTSIGFIAFINSTLTSINIPSSVRTIGIAAFAQTASLNSVALSSGLLSMAGSAFEGAISLTSIVIPSTVTFIDSNAFFNTPLLLNYTYCGRASLTGTGLIGKARTCSVPGAPTIGTATSTGTTTATVVFTAPESNGGSTILSYTATSSPGSITSTLTQAGSGTISVTGLTAGTAYTFTVKANNAEGNSSASAASNSITTSSPAPVVVYIPPAPVPYLKKLTPTRLLIYSGDRSKLYCSAGMYQFGYTIDGVIQGVPAPYIKPTSYIFKLLLNGVAQSLLTLTTSDSAPFWDATGLPSGSIASCSVTVTVNTLTNTATSADLSDENKSKLSAASSLLNQAIRYENNVVLLMNLINSNIYEDALVSNRATWRTAVETNRSSYDAELVRINSLTVLTNPNWPAYIRKLKATARNNYITTLRKNSADYRASTPLALAIKTAANKATLDAKNAAIAKANASYGAAIESIGYGVLIP